MPINAMSNLAESSKESELLKNIDLRREDYSLKDSYIICKSINQNLNTYIVDCQEYIIDMDEIKDNFENRQNELKERYDALLAEMAELQRKSSNGNTTPEEEERLLAIGDEIIAIDKELGVNQNKYNHDQEGVYNKIFNFEEKNNEAENFAKRTIEKANQKLPDFLEEAQDKNENLYVSFWGNTYSGALPARAEAKKLLGTISQYRSIESAAYNKK